MTMKTNKIYNGDCLDLIRDLPDECIDAVITDPPYSAQMQHNGTAAMTSDLNICKPFFRETLKEIKRVLKPGGLVYWFCDWRSYGFFYDMFSEVLPAKNMLVWNKISGKGTYYSFTHELIIFTGKGTVCISGASVIKEAAFCSGARATDGEKVHPTQKPIRLISKLITDSTQKGDLILDCFAGSCTTAVAAIYNQRDYICFELQEKYCEIGEQRVKKAMEVFAVESKEIAKKTLF